jgi:small-conductance mechanosensitive channel
MDIKEITRTIMFGDLNSAQLESVISAVKFARSQLAINAKRSMQVGGTVKFSSPKIGTYTGTIEKIAIKYVTVRTVRGLYKVPASMLEVV